jgi:nucleotide-binding universal stress UspA family protein
VIGVDGSERSEDAVAFGRRIAGAAHAYAVVACAFPYSTSDAEHRRLRDDALETARAMKDRLALPAERTAIRIMARPSPPHALHDLAHAERATLVVVGSTHTGRAGRVLPGSTGERLLRGSPCSVAVVPAGYRARADEPIRRIGVAYDGTDEAKSAVAAATELARSFGAEIEIIGVVASEFYASPALLGGPGVVTMPEAIERHVQESLDQAVADLPPDVAVQSLRLAGSPAEQIAERSAELDLLVVGSRGYGPLRSVLVGGVSGKLVRTAQCPVIVVPRGIEAPLSVLPADAASRGVHGVDAPLPLPS